MEYILFLLFICINSVCCYHFYNPTSHQLLAATSLNNIPSGYRLLPPPRTHRRTSRLTRGRVSGTCGDGGFTCNTPYNISSTLQFECKTDNQCPSNYKCCPQKCFLHKICIQASSQIIDGNKPNCDKQRPGQCEKWPYNCRRPYDYASTYIFKCDRDSRCPRNFKCCQHSCFLHKICSKILTDVETPPVKIIMRANPKNERKQPTTTVTTESKPTTEEQTETDEDTEPTEEDGLASTTQGDDENVETVTEEDEDYGENEDGEPEIETVTRRFAQTEAEREQDTTTEEEKISTQVELIKTFIKKINNLQTQPNSTQRKGENSTKIKLGAKNETGRSNGVVKNTPKLTPLDSNAINPDYAAYYYHYDNTTATDEDYDDYEEEGEY